MRDALDPQTPPALASGTILAGKYRVERTIGVGGMGAVVAARHIELDEPVAVKFLLAGVAPHGEPVARFIREARAAIRIKSDHVVRVFDVGRLENGAPFIVMELLRGCDLSTLAERGPLEVDRAIDYVLQACEAMAAAHAIGIIHRDLKPANLFLTTAPDGSECIKVLDFGISKIAEGDEPKGTGLTSTATVMGTPCFMSPEQLRSTRDVDARADVWSLGAILYALLAGAPPYDGESNADVSAKIIRDPVPPLRAARADASPELEAVVARCLEKDVEKRFASVAELAAALAEVGPQHLRASAARVGRVAAQRALADSEHASVAVTPAQPTSGSAPTRTASAWGGQESTKPEAPRAPRRTVTYGVPVIAVAAIGAAVLIAMTRSTVKSAPAIASAPATATASAPASAPASALAPEPEPASASASAPVSARPPAKVLPASPRVKASAPASAKPKSGGLFDDRE